MTLMRPRHRNICVPTGVWVKEGVKIWSIVYPISRCEELSWVDWEVTELDKGYMYCCDLKSAASALEEIKSLNLKTNVGLIQIT